MDDALAQLKRVSDELSVIIRALEVIDEEDLEDDDDDEEGDYHFNIDFPAIK
jgi:hypothetical protein